jgi:hypothetical protein
MTTSLPPIAVLFARADSIYKSMPGCDVWDIERDALKWPGGAPIIAHPPCRAWAGLSHMAKPRVGERELALWAVDQVRKWGGVLEHSSRSRLWEEKPLPHPGLIDAWGGFTVVVPQYWFGHRAQKMTKLYIVGTSIFELPPIPLRLGIPEFVVGSSGRRADGTRSGRSREITKAEREATPPQLAEWLYQVARLCGLRTEAAA